MSQIKLLEGRAYGPGACGKGEGSAGWGQHVSLPCMKRGWQRIKCYSSVAGQSVLQSLWPGTSLWKAAGVWHQMGHHAGTIQNHGGPSCQSSSPCTGSAGPLTPSHESQRSKIFKVKDMKSDRNAQKKNNKNSI